MHIKLLCPEFLSSILKLFGDVLCVYVLVEFDVATPSDGDTLDPSWNQLF